MKNIKNILIMSLLTCAAITTGWCSTDSDSSSNPSSDDEKGFVIKRRPKGQRQVPVVVDPDKSLTSRNGRIEIPYSVEDTSGVADKQTTRSVAPIADQ